MKEVALIRCESYELSEVRRALEAALSAAGGLSFVTPGLKVAVKANLVSALPPEKAATTHPAVLTALTALLTERGASVTIGDSAGGLYNSRAMNHIYQVTGIRQAEEAGAVLNQNFSEKTVPVPEGKVLRELTYTAWLDDADVIVDCCKLKSHGMMGMTAAVKNFFGTVPGTLKPEYHFRYPNHRDFADMLVDLEEHFKPVLCVADAIVGMEGNGPTAGTPKPLGFLAVSRNAHQLDYVLARILGLTPDSVPTLKAAMERGLLSEDFSSIALAGDWQEFRPEHFAHISERKGILFEGDGKSPLQRLRGAGAELLFLSRPKVQPARCVACGVCQSTCPAKAIEFRNGRLIIDRKKCIRCFCCQEFCPKGAMRVHRPLIARLIHRLQQY